MKTVYVFDCPTHGEETDLFCFRAFDFANLPFWRKFHVTYETADWPENEKIAHLTKLRTSVHVASSTI